MSFDISFLYIYPDETFESQLLRYNQFLIENSNDIGIIVLNEEYLSIVVVPNDCENINQYIDEKNHSNCKDVIGVIMIPESYSTTTYVNSHLKEYIQEYREDINNILLLIIIKEKDYSRIINNLRQVLESASF